MYQHNFSWPALALTLLFAATLLLVPVLALAQSPHEGIYLGAYDGISDDGEFALIVNNLGYGTLAAYDAVDDIGYLESNIYIHADGSFDFVTQRGAHIEGQVSGEGISGTWYAPGTGGSFTGERTADEGPLEGAAGFYAGQVSITRPGDGMAVNGRMVAIIAADGSSFFLLDRAFPGSAGYAPGGLGLGFDFDFDLDLGWGLDLDFGVGFGSGGGSNSGWGGCFPLGFGGNWSFGISIFGLFDVDFNFSRPSCSAFWTWNQFPGLWARYPAAFEYSGGLVQIEPDGLIDDRLLDGLRLQGLLDMHNGYAEGFVFRHQGANAWTGHWIMERRYSTARAVAAERYAALPDIDGDGNADILWRHVVTGESALWLMDNTEIAAELTLEVPAEIQGDMLWSLAAMAELNADGRSDYVYRHAVSGEVFVSFGEGSGSARFDLDPAYRIVGSGDFDADTLPELLVRHGTNGANAVIPNLIGEPVLAPLPEMAEGAWSSVAVADFDGDNHPDVLYVDRRTRDLLIAVMNGMTPVHEIYLPAASSAYRELTGIGDFDGDGSADILRRNHATGSVTVTVALYGGGEEIQLGIDVPRGWQMAAVGDLDGDGGDDLIWRQIATGENVAWHVIDAQVAESATLMPVPDLNWAIHR